MGGIYYNTVKDKLSNIVRSDINCLFFATFFDVQSIAYQFLKAAVILLTSFAPAACQLWLDASPSSYIPFVMNCVKSSSL